MTVSQPRPEVTGLKYKPKGRNTMSLVSQSLNLEKNWRWIERSLLRRLQAQTLPDATPPMSKIYPFTKMAVTFEPVMPFEV